MNKHKSDHRINARTIAFKIRKSENVNVNSNDFRSKLNDISKLYNAEVLVKPSSRDIFLKSNKNKKFNFRRGMTAIKNLLSLKKNPRRIKLNKNKHPVHSWLRFVYDTQPNDDLIHSGTEYTKDRINHLYKEGDDGLLIQKNVNDGIKNNTKNICDIFNNGYCSLSQINNASVGLSILENEKKNSEFLNKKTLRGSIDITFYEGRKKNLGCINF